MNIEKFILNGKTRWLRLKDLLDKINRAGIRKLSLKELKEFVHGFEKIRRRRCHLSIMD